MLKRKIIILDLDGTLIDSSPEILISLRESIKKIINMDLILNEKLIGPPLRDIISKVLPKETELNYQLIENEFKIIYDKKYCTKSRLYIGINQQLKKLIENGVDLILATNKRYTPTMRILKKLGIHNLFLKIYCLDSNNGYKDKSEMLVDIASNKIQYEYNYIGDRQEDFDASVIAKIKFFHASWGYCKKIEELSNEKIILSPSEIFRKIFN